MKYLKISIIFLLFVSCKKKIEEEKILEIDSQVITQGVTDFSLSSIGKEIEYIQLETTKESLLNHDNANAFFTDSVIVVADREYVKFFDRKTGRYLREIKGFEDRGPGGYTACFAPLVYDRKSGNILLDRSEQAEVDQAGIYSMHTGRMINGFDFNPFKSQPACFLNDSVLVVYHPNLNGSNESNLDLISAKDGRVLKSYGCKNKYPTGFGANLMIVINGEGLLWHFGDKVRHHEYTNDTIFTLNPDNLTWEPLFVLNMGSFLPPIDLKVNRGGGPYMILTDCIENSRGIFMSYNYGEKSCDVYFDKKTGRTICYKKYGYREPTGVKNDIDHTVPFICRGVTDHDEFYAMVPAIDFIDNAPEETVKKMGIKEDDNPIIMILKK